MRLPLLCTILLAACAGGEKAPAPDDSTTPVAPAPPPALTAAQVTGAWNGTSKLAGTDSVVSTWTATATSDSTGTFAVPGEKVVNYTAVFSGDSMVATSEAHSTKLSGKAKVMWVSVGRLDAAGALVGTGTTMLAEKHDSVLGRVTWTATKQP
ncbi:MAG: hypothetical protein IPJ11_12165 [Gemmatimonadetes bacterium]|nr:hypothetical protein [Gemmatimonadota bacterium]